MIEPKKDSLKNNQVTPENTSSKSEDNIYSTIPGSNLYQESPPLPEYNYYEHKVKLGGESFLSLSALMSSEEMDYFLQYRTFDDSMKSKIGSKKDSDGGEVTEIEAIVYETEKWDGTMESEFKKNVVKMLQKKNIRFSKNLKIKVKYRIVENQEEMDQGGQIEMTIHYRKIK